VKVELEEMLEATTMRIGAKLFVLESLVSSLRNRNMIIILYFGNNMAALCAGSCRKTL